MMHAARLLLFSALVAVVACGEETPSQTMIVVSLGDGLVAETYDVTVTITSDQPEQSSTETVTRNAFPLCIAVVPFDDDAARTFSARVELRREGVLVASREVETGFVAGEVRAVSLEVVTDCSRTNACEPLRADPVTLPAFASALCSSANVPDGGASDAGTRDSSLDVDSSDAGANDASTDATEPDAEGCVEGPEVNCRFSEVFDVTVADSLRQGFFTDGALILYGRTEDAATLAEVWPAERTIGQYTAQASTGALPTAPLIAGGGNIDGRSCLALATNSEAFTLLNGRDAVTEGTDNHLVVCEADGMEEPVLASRAGPTTGFAMGLWQDPQPAFFYENTADNWFLVTRAADARILGESQGTVSGIRVRGDDPRNCASASFSERWTTYHTNPALEASYESEGGQDAMAGCTTGGNVPSQSYHFGGPGVEEVLSLFVDSSSVIALVRHTAQLVLAIAGDDPAPISSGAGWTLLSLTPEALTWSRTFNDQSSLEMLGSELVVASTSRGQTTLSWHSLSGAVGETHVMDGAWSIIATENEAGVPQRLGFVSAAVEPQARVIILRPESAP